MSENIVGPFGAGINETTTRPGDPNSGSATDTWFLDCVGGVAGTGTKVPAVWLNKVAALLRRAIRGMGVSDVSTDDDMLLKAIQSAQTGVEDLGDPAGTVPIQDGVNPSTNNIKIRRIRGDGVTFAIDPETAELVATVDGQGVPGGSTVYATPGSYTFVVPDGVTRLKARVWGAGGGGGRGMVTGAAGSGAHAGGYAEGVYVVTPGQSIAVNVGAGGAPGTTSPGDGSQGGTSSFGVGCSATGGHGGLGASGTTAALANPAGPGVGSGGTVLNLSGQYAPNAYAIGTGYGSGGAGVYGSGPTGMTVDGGLAGQFPGGGGSGSGKGFAPGVGAGGLVILEY